MSYPRYSQYRDSEVEWLGEIPTHWQLKPLKYTVSCNDQVLTETTSSDLEINYVEISDVSETEGVKNIQSMKFGNAPSRARRIVRDGDTIVSTVRTYLKAIASIENPIDNMVVSTGFAVLRPTPTIEQKFLGYFVKSSYFLETVVAQSVGVSYPATNASDVVNIRALLPPLSEQRAIAAFLDCETSRIGGLIAKQEQLIALLHEKRRALIDHAVSTGLQSEGLLNPTDILWLDRIPRHWTIKRGRYLFQQSSYEIGPYDEIVTCFRNGQVTLRRNRREEGYTIAVKEVGYQGIHAGQLVIHSMDAFAGAIGVSDSDGKSSPEYIVCDPVDDTVFIPYYGYLLRMMALRGFILAACPAVRERAPRIRYSDVAELLLPVPPVSEQRAIVAYIQHEVHQIDTLIDKAQTAVNLLKEHRTSLISAAVTGKIDVRGLGEREPNEQAS